MFNCLADSARVYRFEAMNLTAGIKIKYRAGLNEHVFLPIIPRVSETKILPDLLHRIIGIDNRVANGALVNIDLIVIATLERLVAEKVNRRVLDSARLLGLGLEVAEAERLVPTRGENIERDLAANGVSAIISVNIITGKRKGQKASRQTPIGKLLLEIRHHFLPDPPLFIKLLIGIPLRLRRIPPNRAHIDHAIAKLDKRAPLDRHVQVRNIV